MKICIISDEHFPYKGADTEVIVNTAAALGSAGAQVDLLIPWLWHRHQSVEQLYQYYGVPASFNRRPILNPFPPERILRSQQFLHGTLCMFHPAFWKADVIHSRDLMPLLWAHTLRRPWSYETYRRHAQERPKLAQKTQRLNLKRSIGAISHSEQSRQDLIQLGFGEDAVVVARPGFQFPHQPPRIPAQLQKQLDQLPASTPIIGYVGNIGAGKGVDLCLKAVEPLKETHLLIVGGTADEVDFLKSQLSEEQNQRTTFLGHVPSACVQKCLEACQVLLIPPLQRNSRGPLLDRILPMVLPGTPLKIYGYWASNTPMVAADQPHSTELLKDEYNAFLYDPHNLASFTHTIQKALQDPAQSRTIAQRGFDFVQSLTYQKRAEIFLEFYERRLAQRRSSSL